MTEEWFRRTDWNAQNRDEFFRRLKRARDKSQYLKIQAVVLEDAGQHSAALELVDYYLQHHAVPIWNSQVHGCRALALAALDNPDAAVAAFRLSLEAEREKPNVQTDSWLDFGEFVAVGARADLFDEALTVLAEFEGQRTVAFPVQRFRLHAIRAIILGASGERERARASAARALQEAAATHSGFSRHTKLGLVGQQIGRASSRERV